MIARDGRSGIGPLTTFRVTRRPDEAGAVAFDAERLADHRRDYLTLEGEISGGRGCVSRIAYGGCVVRRDDEAFEVFLGDVGAHWVGRRSATDSTKYRFERPREWLR